MKSGPASFLSPNSLGKHCPHPQTALENFHRIINGLEFGIPSALPPASPQTLIASGTYKLLLHLLHGLQLMGHEELVLEQAAALLQGVLGEGSPEGGHQQQHKQWEEAEVQHFANKSSVVSGL